MRRNKLINLAAIAVLALSGGYSYANPSGATVVRGSVSFSQPNASTLNITNTPGAIINWQQFGIGANEVTRFIQQSSSSAILNRITGQNPSQILGALRSNGRVFLVNPNGVIFGRNSVVDTAGLITSTLNITDNDFINGKLRFEDFANNAAILNQGFIHTSNGGEVVLIAPNVTNEGVIDVENGNLLLAAGQSITVSSLNYDNIEFAVQAPDNKVINIGTMLSDGGSIGVFAGSITNKGTVSANAITVDAAGNIKFVAKADTIVQDGTVTATSETGKGGHIEILGDRVGLFGETTVDASGATGGGEVLAGGDYQGKGDTLTASTTQIGNDSSIKADAINSGDGGKVIVWANDYTLFYGDISAKGGMYAGNGGFVEVSGKQNLGFYGYVDVLAPVGYDGTVLLDPDNLTIVAGLAGSAPNDTAVGGSAPNITFTQSPGLDFTISNGALEQLDGNIELQAEIDITLQAGVSLDLINQTGITTVVFRAGGSILIDGDITTNGADLTLSASDLSATAPSAAGNIKVNGIIKTNGGNLTFNNNNSSDQITISNSIDTGVGKLDVISLKNVIFNGGLFRTDLITSSNGAQIDTMGPVFFDSVILDNVSLNNAGTIAITGGPLDLINGTVLTNAAITGVIDIQSDVGITNSVGLGTIENLGTIQKSAGTGTSTISARVNARNPSNFDQQSGSLNFTDILLDGNVSFAGSPAFTGTVNYIDGATIFGDVRFTDATINGNGDTLSNLGNFNIDGAGTSTFNNVLFNNNGFLRFITASTLDLINGTVLTNSAIGDITFQADANIASSIGGGTLDNNGLLFKSAGTGTSIISATFNANNGASIIIDTGTLSLNGADLILNGALLAGVGVLGENVISNGGIIDIGDDVGGTGKLTISGNLTLDAQSTVVFDLAGTTQGATYDFLDVLGNVTLDGAAIMFWDNGFAATSGDTFDLIQTGGTFSNAFSTVSIPTGVTASTFDNSTVSSIMQLATTTVATNIFFWNVNADGFWDVGTNWLGNVAPTSIDYAVIDQIDDTINITIRNAEIIQGLDTQNNLVLSGTGSLTINGDSQIGGNTLTLGSSGGFINNGNAIIYTQANWSNGNLSGSGNITIHEFGSINISGTAGSMSTTLINNSQSGSTWTSGASTGAGTWINNGLFNINGATSTDGSFTNSSSGVIIKLDPGTTTLNSFNNSGTLNVFGGLFQVSTAFTNAGFINLFASTFEVLGPSFTNSTGAILTGTGTFIAPVGGIDNQGIIRPGFFGTPGILNIMGDLNNNATGVIEVDVQDNIGAAGTSYDLLAISGQADLQGTLDIFDINGYTVTDNDSFTPITFGSRTANQFDTIISLNDGVLVAPTYNATSFDMVFTNFAGIFWDDEALNGLWTDPLNWSADLVPLLTDDVLINGFNVGITDTANALSLTLDAGGSLTLSLGTFTIAGDSTLEGTFNIAGGTLAGAGNLTLNGAFNWNANVGITGSGLFTTNGVTTITGTSTHDISRNWVNGATGVINWQQGTLRINDTFTFTNNGALNANGGVSLIGGLGTEIFNNGATGTFNINNNLTVASSVQFDNDGAVIINPLAGPAVTLTVQSDGTHTGAWDTGGSGDSLFINLGSNDFNSGSSVIGGGLLQVNGGVQNFNTGSTVSADMDIITNATVNFNLGSSVASVVSINFSGIGLNFNDITAETLDNLTINSGSLGGTGDVNVAGAFNWSGGTLTGGGTLTVNDPGSLIISGTNTRTLNNFTLVNNSTGGGNLWSSSGLGDFDFNNGTFINNGLFTITATRGMNSTGGTNLFTNTGTLTGNSTGIATINIPFDNTGAVDVSGGVLDFGSAYTQTAGSTLLSGGSLTVTTLNLNGGTLGGSGTITGNVTNNGGTVQPGGTGVIGTLNITGNYTQTSGVIEIDIQSGDPNPATSVNDILTISGTGDFVGGTLDMLSVGYTPAVGDQFDPVTYGSLLASTTTINSIGASTITSDYTSSLSTTLNIVIDSAFTGIFWDGDAGDGLWTNLLNWDDGFGADILPTSADNVQIGAFNVDITGAADALSLTLDAGGTLTLSNGTFTLAGNSTLNGQFDISGGTFTGAGNVNVNGAFNWSAGGITGAGLLTTASTSTINNGGTLNLQRNWTNSGTVNWQSGNISIITGGGFTNTGIFNANATGNINMNTGLVFDNQGTFNVNSNTSTSGGGSFNNSGTITLASATTLSLGSSVGTESGTWTIGDGTIALTGGVRNINDGFSVTSTTGALTLSAGTLNFNTTTPLLLPASLTVNVAGGTLSGTGDVTVNGGFNWSAGGITGAGLLTTASTSTINNGGTLNLQRNWTNSGTVNWQSGNISIITGGGFTNTGIFNANATGNINMNTGLVFDNQGAFNVNSNTSTSGGGSFNNSGTITTASLTTLSIASGLGTETGTWTIGDGTIAITGGVRNINTGFSVTSTSGSLILSAGSLNFNNATPLALPAGLTVIVAGGTLSGTGDVTVNGGFNWSTGSMNGTGLLTTTGTSTINSAGVLTLQRNWTNSGTVNWDTGTAISISTGGGFTNTGIFNANAGGNISLNTGLVFDNQGAFNVNSNISTSGGGSFNNSGTITLASATTLSLGSSVGTESGTWTIGDGTIAITGGVRNINTGFSVTSTTGALTLSAGTLNFNTATALPVGLTVSVAGGTLGGTGNVVVNGGFNWTAGTMNGTGLLTTAGISTINSGGVLGSSRNWTNSGTVNWNTGTAISITGGGFTNTGIFNANAAGNISLNTGIVFDNQGAFNVNSDTSKSGGGTFQQSAGVLFLNGTTFTIPTLTITGGSLTTAATGAITGNVVNNGGTIQPGGVGAIGTLTITGNYTNTTGSVEIEILSGNADPSLGSYDILAISGTGDFVGGSLDMLSAGYTVTVGDQFEPVIYGSLLASTTIVNPIGTSTSTITSDYTSSLSTILNIVIDSVFTGIFWDGDAGDGLWTNLLNWDDGLGNDVLPTSGDDVLIGSGFLVGITGTANALSLSLDASSTLTLSSGTFTLAGNSTLDGTFNLSGGTLSGAGNLTLNNAFNWSGSSNISGTGLLTTNGLTTVTGANSRTVARNWTNGGTIDWQAGSFNINNVTFTNNNILNTNGGTAFAFLAGTPVISNTSTFNVNNTLSINGGIQFDNTGAVNVDPLSAGAVTLTVASAGTHTGTWDTGVAGDVLIFSNGTNTFNAGSTSGGGDLQLNSGTQNFNTGVSVSSDLLTVAGGTVNFNAGSTYGFTSALTISGGTLNLNTGAALITLPSLTLSGGTLAGGDPITISGAFNWSGSSSISGTGLLTTNGLTTVTGANSRTVARNWTNGGTIDWQAGSFNINNVTFTNNNILNANGGTAFAFLAGTPVISNTSTFNVNNTLSINGGIQFDNDGIVNIDPGAGGAVTLTVASAGTHTGTWDTGVAGDVLIFSNGTNTFNAGSINGGGDLQLNSGTQNFNTGVSVSSDLLTVAGGTVNFNAGSTYGFTSALTISGGTLNLNTGAALITLPSLTLSGGTLAGGDPITISGAFNWSGSSNISGTGLLTTNGLTTVTGANSRTVARNWTNGGTIDWQAGSFNINNVTFTNNNILSANGGTAFGFLAGTPVISNGVSGILNVDSNLTINGGLQFDNDGIVNIDPGAGGAVTLTVNSTGTHTGTWNTGGADDVLSISNLVLTGGSLTGSGTVSGNVTNNGGIVQPGGAGTVGTLIITGNYTQAAGGTTEIEIFDNVSAAGTGYDLLAISTQADTLGTLTLLSIGGYTVTNGDSFTPITFASRTANQFGTINPIGAQPVIPTYNATTFDILFTVFAGIFWDNGAGDGLWTSSANWSGDVLPTTADNVLIGIFNVDITGTADALSLTLDAGGKLTLSSGTFTLAGNSALNGQFDINGGTFTGTSNVTVTGSFNWTAGSITGAGLLTTTGISTINTAGTLNLTRNWINSGTVNWDNGNLSIITGGGFTNTGIFNANATGNLSQNTGLVFDNQGTFNVNSNTSTSGGGNFNNSGTITIASATTLSLGNSLGTESGTWTIGDGTIALTGGVRNINTGFSVTSSTGALTIGGGTLNFNTATALPVGLTVNVSGGTLGGTGNVVVNGGFNWTAGTMNGTGLLTTAGISTINSAGVLGSSRNWTNTGTINWDTGTAISITGGGFTNTGIFNANAGGNISLNTGIVFDNQGAFNVNNNTSTSGGGSFNNSGTITIAAATTLSLGSSLGTESGTGTWAIGDGTIVLTGGVRNINNVGFSVTSTTGALTIDGGTLNFNTATALPVGLTVNVSGGTLGGTGNVVVNGGFNWTAGTMNGTGLLTTAGISTINSAGVLGSSRNWTNTGTVNWDSGSISINTGGAFTNTGIFNANASGNISLNTGIVFDNQGAFNVNNNTSTSGGGSFNNSGTITIAAATTLSLGSSLGTESGTGTWAIGDGTIVLTGGVRNINNVGFSVTSTTGALTIDGGTLNFNTATALPVGLTVNVSGGTLGGTGNVVVNGGFNWTAGTMNGTGLLTTAGISTINSAGVLGSSRNWTNTGTVNWDSGSISINTGGAFTNTGIFNANASGNFNLNSGVIFDNQNIFNVNTNTSKSGGGVFQQNAGQITLSSTTFTISTLILNGGVLSGDGIISGAVVNNGATIQPGGAGIAGTLTITGNYTQAAGGTTEIELLNNIGAAGTGYDLLEIGGQADTSGTLTLLAIGGYTVTNGDSFTPITFASRTANQFGAIIKIGAESVTPAYNATTFDILLGGLAGISWIGGTDTLWTTDANWSGGVAPKSSDDVLIGAFLVDITGTANALSLTLDAGGTLTLSSGTLTIVSNSSLDGTLNISGGTLNTVAVIDINGAFNWSGGVLSGAGITTITSTGLLNMTGTNNPIALDGHSLVNDATAAASWSSATFDLNLLNNATFTNNQTLNFTATASVTNGIGANSIVNNGTMIVNNAGSASIGSGFSNNGSVDIQSGTLSVNGNSTSSGNYTVAGTLQLGGAATHTFTDSSITGAGTVRVASGTVNLNDTGAAVYNITGLTEVTGGVFNINHAATIADLNLITGSFGGSGVLNVTNSFNWTGAGTLGGGSGSLTINPTATLIISGATGRNFTDYTLINNSNSGLNTLSMSGGANIGVNNASIINNGTLNITSTTSMSAVGGTTLFSNTATGVITVNSAGTATFNMPFDNAGSLDVQTGTLALNGNSTYTDLLNIDGVLELGGATHTLTDVAITGAGIFRVKSGTVNLNSTGSASYNMTGLTEASGGIFNINYTATIADLNLITGSFGGSGVLNVTNSFNWTGAGTLGGGSGSLTINPTATLIISGATGRNFTDYTLINNSNSGLNTLSMSGGANIGVNNASIINNGTLNITSTTSMSAVGGTTLFSNTATGVITVNSAGTATFNMPFDNAGSLDVQSGTLQFGSTYTQTAGSTLLSGGALTVTTLNLDGGTLGGSGAITGDVINNGGIVQPGGTGSIGTLTINGDFTQIAGTVEIEIQSTGTAGTNYDLLALTGTGVATLADILNLIALGYTESLGDTFAPLSYVSVTGAFADVNPPGVEGAVPTYGGISLNVVIGLVGLNIWDGNTDLDGGDGINWNDALNWSLNLVPKVTDDVEIGSAFSVIFAPTANETIKNLVLDGNLSITANTLTVSGILTQGNTSTLNISGGGLTLTNNSTFGGIFALNSGTFTVNAISTLNDAFNWNGGTIGGAGQLVTNGISTLNGVARNLNNITWNNNGTVDWVNGDVILTSSTINNQNGSTWNVLTTAPTDDITGNGTINFNGAIDFNNGTTLRVTSGAGAPTINFGSGASINLVSGSASMVFGAAVPVNLNTSLNIPAGLNVTLTGATLNVNAGITTIFSTFTNNGNVNIQGGALILAETGAPPDGGDYSITSGTLQFDTGRTLTGVLTMTGGAMNVNALVSLPAFTNNNGAITVATGGLLFMGANNYTQTGSLSSTNIQSGAIFNSGLFTLGTAPLAGDGGALVVNGSLLADVFNLAGNISGSGSINGNLDNNSNLSPGSIIGTLTINGTLTLLANSNLILNISDAGENAIAGTDYDLLNVNTIIIDGTLTTVVDVTNYAAQLDDTFNPVTYSSSTGVFASVINNQGFAYDLTYNPTTVNVVTTAIPGLVLPADPISEAVTSAEILRAGIPEDVTDIEQGIVADDAEGEEDTTGQTMVCS